MKRKLIALDLDGTTLNGKTQITQKTKEVLNKAQQAGHVVSIVTGRPNRMAVGYYDELKLKGPMINFNGALGYIPHKQWEARVSDDVFQKHRLRHFRGKTTPRNQGRFGRGQDDGAVRRAEHADRRFLSGSFAQGSGAESNESQARSGRNDHACGSRQQGRHRQKA
ncbi:hypothetical protein ANHS_1646 [Ligilactobacillus ruminis ATCC 25644]|nr:hypothetical protein ANHS_1646 [Ligilactobacillus ruminis ATCC 25644]